MDTPALDALFADFRKKKVLVIGDVMCDAYWWGDVDRVSPEAPVPVVNFRGKEYRLGGAANVALNLKKLGAEPLLCSVMGTEQEGDAFCDLLENEGIATNHLIRTPNRPTTVKTRVLGNKHQLVRLDSETTAALDDECTEHLLLQAREVIGQADAVLFVDYNKGVLTGRVIDEVITLANQSQVPVAVDPKKQNFFRYQNTTLFKPNLKELADALEMDLKQPVDINAVYEATLALNEKIRDQYALITLSEQGVFITDHKQYHHLPAHLRAIYDVSGAGDTVISVATLALTCGLDMAFIAEMANIAGGLVCEEVGVIPIDRDKFYRESIRILVNKERKTLDKNGVKPLG